MIVVAGDSQINAIAQDLFEVVNHLGLAMPRNRRGNELKEIEYRTLAILHERGPLIVGDIQRWLGVLPAQMSRIIRALEMRSEPLILRHIHPQDRRKIDVRLTNAGEKSLREYQAMRGQRIAELLCNLSEDEQSELRRLLDRLRALLKRRK